jgi:hypothetical protein
MAAVVIDNGTGYTKMGYAGNCEPSFIVPSIIGTKDPTKAAKAWKGVEDLDFWIGDEAAARSTEYSAACALMPAGERRCATDRNPPLPRSRQLSDSARHRRELGQHGALLAAVHLQIPAMRPRGAQVRAHGCVTLTLLAPAP